ncbi:MAG: hypothetical protein JHC33_00905 [Ignisphaera sp.]|nr:hypothetical protein [Ignisphaera sp.]
MPKEIPEEYVERFSKAFDKCLESVASRRSDADVKTFSKLIYMVCRRLYKRLTHICLGSISMTRTQIEKLVAEAVESTRLAKEKPRIADSLKRLANEILEICCCAHMQAIEPK